MPDRVFRFRGVRMFQAILAFIVVVTTGGAAALLSFVAGGDWRALPVAVVLLLVASWALVTAVRLPGACLRVSAGQTGVRFPGAVDATLDNEAIAAVRVTEWHAFPGGLGVRTDLRGMVALVCAGGAVVEFVLRQPLRIWLIPGVWRARARRLILSVETPDEVVAAYVGRLAGGGA